MIRIAFAGKGGSGKSSISGSFARLLAQRGRPVLAVDSDPLPGMAYSLGVPVVDSPTPDDVVVEGPEGGPKWILRPGLDAAGFVDTYSAVGPDNVRYMQFGNTWGLPNLAARPARLEPSRSRARPGRIQRRG